MSKGAMALSIPPPSAIAATVARRNTANANIPIRVISPRPFRRFPSLPGCTWQRTCRRTANSPYTRNLASVSSSTSRPIPARSGRQIYPSRRVRNPSSFSTLATGGPLFLRQQRRRDECQLLPLSAKRRAALYPTGESQSHRTVKDAPPPKGLGQGRHLAANEDPARTGSFRLQNVVAFVDEATPERIQPLIALTARDGNVDLLRQPSWTEEVISRERLFEPARVVLLEPPCDPESPFRSPRLAARRSVEGARSCRT